MTFHVGQMVVFVLPPKPHLVNPGTPWPLDEKRIYTIRDIDTRMSVCGWPNSVRLEEVRCAVHRFPLGLWEDGYAEVCFRPVKPTDISILKQYEVPNAKPVETPVHVGAGVDAGR